MKAHPPPQDLREALDASERRAEGLLARLEGTQGIIDAISEAIYIHDAEGRFLDVNAGATRMYGYPRDFFAGKTAEVLSAPGRNDLEAVAAAFKKALQGEPQQFEFWGLRRNGDIFPKDVRLYPGTYLGQSVVIAIAQDITGKKRAEQIRDATYRISEAALRAKDLQSLYRSVHDILRAFLPAENCFIALHDAGNDTISWPYWVDQVDEAPPARRFGRGLTEYVIRTGQPQLLDETRLADLVAAGEAAFMGSESLAWMGVPLRNDQRVFGALVIQSYEGGYRYLPEDLEMLSFVSVQIAMAIDRKAAEEKFRFVSAAVDVSQDSLFWVNKNAGIEFVNAAACQGLGYTREELMTLTLQDIDPSFTLDYWRTNWEAVRQGTAQVRETTHRRKDGTFRPVEIARVMVASGGRELIFASARDITERKKVEAALLASEEKFSRAFHASPDAINLTRLDDGTYLDVSQGFERLTGWKPEEVIGRSALDLNLWVDPRDRQRVVELMRDQGEYTGLEIQFRRKDGSLLTGLMSGKAMEVDGIPCLLSVTRDITDRKATEQALRQSQKLESLGILAGGIAHDFNNLLTVVLGNLNLAQMHLPEDAPAQPYLANMEATVLRATELTKQMLAYSGRGHFLVKPQDLNEAVREVTHLLEVSISKKIWLRFDLEPGLPAIHADAAQIQQVVMNLVTNASDAIGDMEGIIHLTTSMADLDQKALQATYRGDSLAPGRYVLLEVADTGIGMSQEVMARIFDPFFTTKATGRGLGLSAMLGILRGHGAGLRIASEVGRGTSFGLCFPASDEQPIRPVAPPEAASFHPLRGRVLLVDDEDLILQTIGSALMALGLDVLTARDGLEALERFREARPRPDLVLMDLTMPRMDGREAFLAMHGLDPSIPVVLSSGFTESDSAWTLSGPEPAAFMQKPYQIRELRRLLQSVLEG
jgi:PAS domain S-box-containing protein